MSRLWQLARFVHCSSRDANESRIESDCNTFCTERRSRSSILLPLFSFFLFLFFLPVAAGSNLPGNCSSQLYGTCNAKELFHPVSSSFRSFLGLRTRGAALTRRDRLSRHKLDSIYGRAKENLQRSWYDISVINFFSIPRSLLYYSYYRV